MSDNENPVPDIDPDDMAEYNRPFSPQLSDVEQPLDTEQPSDIEPASDDGFEQNESDVESGSASDEGSAEEYESDADDVKYKKNKRSSSTSGPGRKKKKEGDGKAQTKKKSYDRMSPVQSVSSQHAFIDFDESEESFNICYTPLSNETIEDPQTKAITRYSIGIMSVETITVTENEFMTAIYEVCGLRPKNPVDVGEHGTAPHSCRPPSAIATFVKSTITKASREEIIAKIADARRFLSNSKNINRQPNLLLVAVHLPLHLEQAIMSPLLSYCLRVTVFSERINGTSADLPAASRFFGFGTNAHDSKMHPILLSDDEQHRYGWRAYNRHQIRCTENLPILANCAYTLECTDWTPIYVPYALGPNSINVTMGWEQTIPETTQEYVLPEDRNGPRGIGGDVFEIALHEIDNRSGNVSWNPPVQYEPRQLASFVVVPSHARNTTTMRGKTLRTADWTKTPLDLFSRHDNATLAKAPAVAGGPCLIEDFAKKSLTINQRRRDRAAGALNANLKLAHAATFFSRTVGRYEITPNCSFEIDRNGPVSLWINSLVEANGKLNPLVAMWCTNPTSPDMHDAVARYIGVIAQTKDGYLDTTQWPTNKCIEHVAFAEVTLMGPRFWHVAYILSFHVAVGCLLYGTLKNVYDLLLGRTPYDVFSTSTLEITGPTILSGSPVIPNFISARSSPVVVENVARYAYSVCLAHEPPWNHATAVKMADKSSLQYAVKVAVSAIREISTAIAESVASFTDCNFAFVTNCSVQENALPLFSDGAIRADPIDCVGGLRTTDGESYIPSVVHTEIASKQVQNFAFLLNPFAGPFKKRGLEVVRCETRNQHDQAFLFTVVRIVLQLSRDIFVWCSDRMHVEMAIEVLDVVGDLKPMMLSGGQLINFFKTEYTKPESVRAPKIFLFSPEERFLLLQTTRHPTREKALVCIPYAHQVAHYEALQVLNSVTSNSFATIVACTRPGSGSTAYSKPEADTLLRLHQGFPFELGIPGMTEALSGWRRAAVGGDELVVIGLPLAAHSPCGSEKMRGGSSLVDDLYFSAPKQECVVSFEAYSRDYESAFPAQTFIRCVSGKGGFLESITESSEDVDALLGGTQRLKIGDVQVLFLERSTESMGFEDLPEGTKDVCLYWPVTEDCEVRTSCTDFQHAARSLDLIVHTMSPVPHFKHNPAKNCGYSSIQLTREKFSDASVVVFDSVPSNEFGNPTILFSGRTNVTKALVDIMRLKEEINERQIEEDEVTRIVKAADDARQTHTESLFDMDAIAWFDKIVANIESGRLPLEKRIDALKSYYKSARFIRRGVSIDAIMALFFYAPRAVVWHGDSMESIIHRFHAKVGAPDLFKTPLEHAMETDNPVNWFDSYAPCSVSALPYVLGPVFDGVRLNNLE